MNLRCIAFAGISFAAFICGCSSSIAGSATSSSVAAPVALSADASLHQLQAQGVLPTLDVSTSLLGTDSDGNGVRDDIDKYIAGLPDTAAQKKALTQFAQAIQSTLTVSKTSPTALANISHSTMRGDTCIWQQYKSGQSAKALTVEALTINTMVRLSEYEKYNAAQNGSTITMDYHSPCD